MKKGRKCTPMLTQMLLNVCFVVHPDDKANNQDMRKNFLSLLLVGLSEEISFIQVSSVEFN